MQIDFVIPWVDWSDVAWQKRMSKYKGQDYNDVDKCRYRDWDNLKYWFRGVEKYAPWVNTIHFVTDNQLPDWLNVNNPKINVVNHSDYIPKEYLPTFSANPIELNFHRIKGLNEHFIYFNDDMFLNSYVKEEVFFKKNLPCYLYGEVLVPEYETNLGIFNIIKNDVNLINKNFNKKTLFINHMNKVVNIKYGLKRNILNLYFMIKNKNFSWFYYYHNACPFLKSTIQDVWETEYEYLDKVSKNKFRTVHDVNQYLFSYWDLARGNFYPYMYSHRVYHINKNNIDACVADIKNSNVKLLCINDNELAEDFEYLKAKVNSAFDEKFPTKSSFEK